MHSGAHIAWTLCLSFLTEAYHHVKHIFPLLALAASRMTTAIARR
ncbi:hypothetical protein [Methylosinus sp. RM1]|nr:hypothetical protein [Methylosinus sp. RM1]